MILHMYILIYATIYMCGCLYMILHTLVVTHDTTHIYVLIYDTVHA